MDKLQNSINLTLKFTTDESNDYGEQLREALIKAEDEYTTKKKAKGEEIDYIKMRNAINQRKNIRRLCKLTLASVLSCGNILDKPTVNRAVEKLERDALFQKVGRT